jgi:hypothetical protein
MLPHGLPSAELHTLIDPARSELAKLRLSPRTSGTCGECETDDVDLTTSMPAAGGAAGVAAGGAPGSRAGGLFLNAVAAAEAAAWGLEGRHAACAFAAKLREEVAAVAGSDAAARALLRQCTRDGRLYPGLAPPIEGPIVRSEHGETTPEDEVEAALGGVVWR